MCICLVLTLIYGDACEAMNKERHCNCKFNQHRMAPKEEYFGLAIQTLRTLMYRNQVLRTLTYEPSPQFTRKLSIRVLYIKQHLHLTKKVVNQAMRITVA